MGLILGKVNGGRFRNLERLRIRAWPLIILAFILQIYPMFTGEALFFEKFHFYAYGASYLLLIICILFNMDQKGVWLILIGLLMNTIVIFLNKMQMPVSFEGLKMAGLEEMVKGISEGKILHLTPLEDIKNWTRILGKYIVIPKPYPLSKVLSIGDLLMTLGIILWVRGEMARSIFSQRTEMLKFRYKR